MSTVDVLALDDADAKHALGRLPLQETSLDIWDKKYRLKTKDGDSVDHNINDTFERVARALAEVERNDSDRKHWYEQFVWALEQGAIPAGRITSNAGALEHKPATSTINCTVSGTVEDSMDDILGKVHEAGLTLKAGCGIGYDFSTLRPHGAYVSGAGAYTSGPLSFMDIFDKMCFTVSLIPCVSPCLLPVAVVVHRWALLMSGIPMSLNSSRPNVKTDACASSICLY